MAASNTGNYYIVQQLLKAGADVNIKTNNGKTAISLAQQHSTDTPAYQEIIEILNAQKMIKRKREGEGESAFNFDRKLSFPRRFGF